MIDDRLTRAVGVRAATAINVITMIGIGPLVTVPLVLGSLHGPLSLAGWLGGALLALCDGLVWAELGSLYPGSGGTYGFLRDAFGRLHWGRLLAFLFVWQTIFVAPLLLATGYIGFANYAGYFVPALATTPWMNHAVAIGVGLVTVAALYRAIRDVSRASSVLAVVAVVTLLCVIVASYARFSAGQAFALPAHDSVWDGLRAGLGQALIITMYDYFGYGASAAIGGELRDPARTLPRSIVISILLVAFLYLAMQVGILGALHADTLVPAADGSLPPIAQHLGSAIAERTFGVAGGVLVTVLVLATAFASVYGNLLGYSRVPFAAAGDGVFLSAFAHVHRRDRFPDVSLIVIGALALPACLFPLDAIINALTAGIVLIQSVAQCIAVLVVRRRGIRAPYRMGLFPLPVFAALAGWLYIFVEAGAGAIAFGLGTLAVGAVVFLARAYQTRAWPFVNAQARG